jgi:hypothetical protein
VKGDSDSKGSVASSYKSKLPDTQKRARKIQNLEKAWVLQGEITTNLLHNDSGRASMGGDTDDDAKVQNTNCS